MKNEFKVEDNVLTKYTGKEKYVTVPEGVEVIGKEAFKWCYDVEKMILPNSLKIIEEHAFEGCRSLKEIHIPEGVVKIEDNVFGHCFKLEEIYLSSTVEEIGVFAFGQCNNLVRINIHGGNKYFKFENNCLYDYCGETLLKCCNNVSIDIVEIMKGVKMIALGAFAGCENFTKIEIPQGVIEIPDETFLSCENLESIILPNTIERIGAMAFASSGIEEITLPHSVQNVEFLAFSSCKKLKTVIVESKDTELDKHAFGRSDKVTIYAPKDSKAEVFAKEKGFKFKELVDSGKANC